MKDNALVSECWDLREVSDTAKRHRVPSNDIYGALFFHIKEELTEFAKRTRKFNITVDMQNADMEDVSQKLKKFVQDYPDQGVMFDRIDASNVLDSVGLNRIILDWGPLLNFKKDHAALLAYSMNWEKREPRALPDKSMWEKIIMRFMDYMVC